MSSESIDLLWNESIHKLKELVQQEDASSTSNKQISINDAFSHFAKLYIQYTLLLNNFNTCYTTLVQPQKRIDIKKTLQLIICRIINLRFLLVKWHPPNSDVIVKNSGIQTSFPWEYVDITKELQELSVSPSQLITCTPSYFKEDQLEVVNKRNATVISLLQKTFGSEVRLLEEKSWSVESSSSSAANDGVTSSIAVVEDNNTDLPTTTEEPTIHHDDTKKKNPLLSEQEAATKVQSTIRGHQSRNKTSGYKVWLDNLVGLSSDNSSDTKNELHLLENNLNENHQQRYQEQKYCKESYENDLHRLKNVVKEEEGFNMSNQLRDERTKWITDYTIKNNSLPDSFEDFYKKDLPTADEDDDDKENKDAKGSKQKNAKDASSADKKSKDKKDAIVVEVERPTLAAPQTLLDPLKESIQIYEERWMHRTVGQDRIKSQSHDVEMAKDLIVRDQVRSELTIGVEEKLLSNIIKIKAMQEQTKKSKSKKSKDGKGKKKGGKKAGGKKEKPLPGAKLAEMKDMSVDEMLSILVQNGLVSLPDEEYKLHDFIGGFDNGRPKLSTDMDKQERWVPQDPSAFQLRKSIMEYCILPLGSEDIKSTIQDDENVRSVLFYGPEGSGKTHMVQTIASEIGALMINLSSSSIKGDSFEGKEGATKLIHMVFTIAKEKSYGPVLIYLDDCHEFFMGKGKSKSKGGGSASNINTEMQRFQKDLLIYKNQALKKEDRVLVIGCTNMPEVGDIKLLRWKGSGKPEKQGFFEKSLYFPRVNNADRAMLWREFIQRRISQFNHQLSVSEQPSLDYAALAFISDGYNAGQISWTVDTVLTEERIKTLLTEPLVEVEFAHYFTAREVNDDSFLNFTRQITTLDTVWKSINAGDKSSSGAKKKK